MRYVIAILLISMTLSACNTKKSLSECEQEHQQLEKNKEMVVVFYQELFGDKNLDAIDKYIGETYIQHNPMAPDGKEALRNILKDWFINAPKDSVDFQYVGAYGDRVFLHIRTNLMGKEHAVVDIFRIENGKIVEHWDVLQAVPEQSKNDHPMF